MQHFHFLPVLDNLCSPIIRGLVGLFVCFLFFLLIYFFCLVVDHQQVNTNIS